MEERRAGAAVCLWYLDGHDAQVEELVDELAGDMRLFVHLADERADFAVGELVHAVAKQRFVLVKTGQSGHRVDLRHGGIIAERRRTMRYQTPIALFIAVACCLLAARRPRVRRLSSRALLRPPQPPRRPTAPAQGDAASSRRQPVFRAGINFVRVDVIVTDKKGEPVTNLTRGGLRGPRGRQAADDRTVPPHSRRRQSAARRAAAARASQPHRRRDRDLARTTCGCSSSSWTTTTCGWATRSPSRSR